MPQFKNLKDLEKYLNNIVKESMKEVAETVRDVEQETIDKEVYDKYHPSSVDGEPWIYQRRREHGGLKDRKNMIEHINETENGVEMTIENVTTGSDNHERIDDLIEYGDGTNGKQYDFKKNRDDTAWQYLRGRPFTKSTAEELERSKRHVETLKRELRDRGINVE